MTITTRRVIVVTIILMVSGMSNLWTADAEVPVEQHRLAVREIRSGSVASQSYYGGSLGVLREQGETLVTHSWDVGSLNSSYTTTTGPDGVYLRQVTLQVGDDTHTFDVSNDFLLFPNLNSPNAVAPIEFRVDGALRVTGTVSHLGEQPIASATGGQPTAAVAVRLEAELNGVSVSDSLWFSRARALLVQRDITIVDAAGTLRVVAQVSPLA